MKTSTMVWVLVVVLALLGIGWYVWGQGSDMPAQQTTTDMQTASSTTPTSTDSGMGTPTNTPNTSTSAPMSATVTYDGTTFTPASVTIAKGGTVTFADTNGTMWLGSDPHPIHDGYDGTTRAQHCAAGYTGAKPFDQCGRGSSYSFTFDKVGSWGYHDHSNSAAGGSVVVK